jgi:hypothetical protein
MISKTPFVLFFFFALAFSLTLGGCAGVTVDLKKPSPAADAAPSMVDYRDYYFGGFFQSRQIDLNRACLDQTPVRLRSYASAQDVLFTLFTFGIYMPRTVEIWCESPEPKEARR